MPLIRSFAYQFTVRNHDVDDNDNDIAVDRRSPVFRGSFVVVAPRSGDIDDGNGVVALPNE